MKLPKRVKLAGLPELVGKVVLYVVIVPVIFPHVGVFILIQTRPIYPSIHGEGEIERGEILLLICYPAVSMLTMTVYCGLRLVPFQL